MARYEHLPIYRKSFDLTVLVEQSVGGFARRHKFGLGQRLQSSAQEILTRVVRAQNESGEERATELRGLRIEVEVAKNLLHLGKEVQTFPSFAAYRRLAEVAVDIGRQVEGWLKSTRGNRTPESRAPSPSGRRP